MSRFIDASVKIIHRFILARERFLHQSRIIIRIVLILEFRQLSAMK